MSFCRPNYSTSYIFLTFRRFVNYVEFEKLHLKIKQRMIISAKHITRIKCFMTYHKTIKDTYKCKIYTNKHILYCT